MAVKTIKRRHPLDSKATLHPLMLADGTVDALIRECFAVDHELPERREAREATKEYCIRYLAQLFNDSGEWEVTLGDLAVSLGFFYDGYRSGLKREVILG